MVDYPLKHGVCNASKISYCASYMSVSVWIVIWFDGNLPKGSRLHCKHMNEGHFDFQARIYNLSSTPR
jgi:hypothetical protein